MFFRFTSRKIKPFRQEKPFTELVAYKKLVKRAESLNCRLEQDDFEIVSLTALDGLIFNDQIDYDLFNINGDRKEALEHIRHAISYIASIRAKNKSISNQ